MKKRITSLILVIMVVLSPFMFVNAQSDEHIHSENCIYSCELDKIDTVIFESKSQNVSTHVDHPGSENCIYSCILENIDGTISDFHIEDIDERNSEIELITEKDVKNFIDEYTGIATISLKESKENLAEMLEITVEELETILASTSLSCLLAGHDYRIYSCTGNHYGSPNSYCSVLCARITTCNRSDCTWSGTMDVPETAHSWSTGWCAKTCTNCGTREPLHSPGGCWYCS